MDARNASPLLFLELYSFAPAWVELGEDERTSVVEAVIANVDKLTDLGITVLGYGRNDLDTSRRAPYDFFAVYQVPDLEMQRLFEEEIRASGWYDLFEQVNLRGSAIRHREALLSHVRDPASAPAIKTV